MRKRKAPAMCSIAQPSFATHRARGRWRRKLSTRVQGAREGAALFLALIALDAARDQLDCYARLTDEPEPGTVGAADLLDAARDAMVTP
jgi:hypothetical protein